MGAAERIRADLINFARGYTRSRIGLFFGLAFPVILILLFGAIFAGNGSPAIVYAQNQDNGSVGAQFLQVLNSTGALQVSLVPTTQNFSQYLNSHSSADGIVVPPGFTLDYAEGKSVNVTEYWNPSSATSQAVFGV